jgi:hypothetical protein
MSQAYSDAREAAYKNSPYAGHYDSAYDLATQLSQLQIWLAQTEAKNLYYINNQGEVISAIGRDPDDFISNMSSGFTITHQDTSQGIMPIVEHEKIINAREPSTVSRRTPYNFKTLMRYEQVEGPEKAGSGLIRIDRKDGVYLVGIPLMPEDFETQKLFDAFKKLFEVMAKTDLQSAEKEILTEGLEERGDIQDDVREELIKVINTGRLLFDPAHRPDKPHIAPQPDVSRLG